MSYKKVQNFFNANEGNSVLGGIYSTVNASRGGIASQPSASTAAEIALTRTLVDTKWIAISGAFTGSQLSGFSTSAGVMLHTAAAPTTYFVYGQVSVVSDVDTHLRLAIVKNGSVISGSTAIATVKSGSWLAYVEQPVYSLVSFARVSLDTNDTVAMRMICNTTGSNIWSKTANLVVQQ